MTDKRTAACPPDECLGLCYPASDCHGGSVRDYAGPLDPQLTRRLTDAYGVKVTADPVELQLRVMKIGEEFGEAIEALIGMQGWNPRKGYTHTLEDVEDELADVVITAWMALAAVSLTPDAVIDDRLVYVVERMEAARAAA